MTGVYQILNTVSGNFYIGSSSNHIKVRKRKHFDDLRKGKHHNEPLQRAYDKYGKDVLVFHVLCATKKEQTIEVEQMYIDWMKPAYNTCKNARSVSGIKRSKEACQAISDRMKGNTIWKGRTMSEEAKIKIGLANKGRKPHNTGKTRSQETKDKIAQTLRDRHILRNQ